MRRTDPNRFRRPPTFGDCLAPFPYQPTFGGLAATPTLPVGAGAGAGAESGAVQGAAIGTEIVPVLGTAIGTVIGAAIGAIAGSIGKRDPEQYNFDAAVQLWQQNPDAVYNIGNKYLPLAGLFDLNITTNIPIYKKFGRMGEQAFVTAMVQQIYNAAKAGKISPNDTAVTIFQNVVQPWINSFGYGAMQDPHADLINRLLVGMIFDYATGAWRNEWYARGGDFPFGSLPDFPSLTPAASSAAPATNMSTPNPVTSGTTLTHDTAGTMSTPYGTFASLAGGAFTFTPPGGATQQIALTPAHTGGVGTLSLTYTGSAVIATNSDGTLLQFNPAATTPATTWSPYSGPPPASSPSTVGASTPIPTTTPAPLVVGTPITTAQDSVTGQMMAIPAGGTYGGVTPSGAWLVVYPAGTQYAGTYTLANGVLNPYGANTTAPATVSVPTTIPTVQPTTAAGATVVGTTSSGQQVTQADLQALVSQIAAQGASAQQAYTAAMTSLQSQGVQPSPQVQSAVQSAVSSTPAPTAAGLSLSNPWIAGGLVVLTVMFATARPASNPVRRRARAR